jgi:xanthine dehydrogenase iron-sulfur cluster and FAD-binding subunit A
MTALDTAAPLAVHRSRKLIPEFRLHRPRSATEAVAMKAAAGPGGVYMAGGIDVVNRMKSGLPVTDAIHLGLVAGLDGIAEVDNRLRLGALVTHDRLATSPLVRARLPVLAQTWPMSPISGSAVRARSAATSWLATRPMISHLRHLPPMRDYISSLPTVRCGLSRRRSPAATCKTGC